MMRNKRFVTAAFFLATIGVILLLSSLFPSRPVGADLVEQVTITPTVFIYLPFVVKNWSPIITPTPPCPEPGRYTGTTPSISFDVTEDQQVCNQVCNFDIRVPFGAGSCRIRPISCAEIADNDFSFSRSEIGAIYVITGTFDILTHAFGNYRVSMCEDTIVIPPSKGTWEASK